MKHFSSALNPHLKTLAVVGLGLILSSCRGVPFEKPPIHPNQNMDFSEAFESQEKNTFFEDGRAMRTPVEGTISRNGYVENSVLISGKLENGDFVDMIPVNVDKTFMERGKHQYNIYCTPCHGITGAGNGPIVSKGLVPPPSYHDERLINSEDGYLYDVITNGVRSMYPYNSQIPVPEDRWAIVAYIRALQQSQVADEDDLKGFKFNEEALNAYRDKIAAIEEEKARQAEATRELSTEELVAMGSKLYTTKTCQTCHSLDGTRLVGPTFKASYGRTVEFEDGTSSTADEAYLTESILNSNAKVVKGYVAAMPNFSALLTDTEVKALVEYIKTVK